MQGGGCTALANWADSHLPCLITFGFFVLFSRKKETLFFSLLVFLLGRGKIQWGESKVKKVVGGKGGGRNKGERMKPKLFSF